MVDAAKVTTISQTDFNIGESKLELFGQKKDACLFTDCLKPTCLLISGIWLSTILKETSLYQPLFPLLRSSFPIFLNLNSRISCEDSWTVNISDRWLDSNM